MKQWAAHRIFGLSILCLAFLPLASRAASTPQCLQQTWIAPGQRTVTPAMVTGSPLERLPLQEVNPADRTDAPQRPGGSYLITGNKVDLVTTCAGFAYVRFHGPQRVSTGWVDAARIKATGPAHGTLPPGAAMLCEAAEDTLNGGKQLASLPMTNLDNDALNRILPPDWQPDPNSSPTQVAHIVVAGRQLAAIVVDSGGTAHSTSVYVLSDDLKTLLSPLDRDSRDVENDGPDDWGFGVGETVVAVRGQPMVLSWNGSIDNRGSNFHLSLIDRDGDIVPACKGQPGPLKKPALAFSADAPVCHAFLAGRQATVPMHPPAPGESLALGKVPTQFSDHDGRIRSTATELNYHDAAMAADVRYALLRTGIADLDNGGGKRHVGIVSFWEGNSSAGDGSYTDSQVFPVYFGKHGVADLSADANRKLIAALPHGGGANANGELATLDGVTYFETSPRGKGPTGAVWKIDADGVHQVCGFKLLHEVVRPVSE